MGAFPALVPHDSNQALNRRHTLSLRAVGFSVGAGNRPGNLFANRRNSLMTPSAIGTSHFPALGGERHALESFLTEDRYDGGAIIANLQPIPAGMDNLISKPVVEAIKNAAYNSGSS